jgi:hypothetical protein
MLGASTAAKTITELVDELEPQLSPVFVAPPPSSSHGIADSSVLD